LPTKTYAGLPKQKQIKIFKAALNEFANKGYSMASTNSICKAANISKGSIFQYFSTKEDLFFFIVRKALSEVIKVYKADYQLDTDNLSLKEIFMESCLQLIDIYENYPNHYKIYLRINYEIDAPNYIKLRRYLAKYVSIVTYQFIDIGKKRAMLKEDIPSGLLRFIINSFIGRFVEACFIPGYDPTLNFDTSSLSKKKEIINEIYKLLIEGIGKI